MPAVKVVLYSLTVKKRRFKFLLSNLHPSRSAGKITQMNNQTHCTFLVQKYYFCRSIILEGAYR